MEIVILTQEMIELEKDTWCDPLQGCRPGDRAVWSEALPSMSDLEPFLVGLTRLLVWLEQEEEEEKKKKIREVIVVLAR